MYQTDPSLSHRTQGAACAEHVQRPAVTICSRCGNYACDACLRVGDDRQDYCFRCVPQAQSRLATPSSRFFANAVDRLAPLLPLALVGFAAGNDSVPLGVLGFAVSLALIVWQLYLLFTSGQSMGKRLVGIKVIRVDGSPVSLGRLILLRNVVPGILGLVTCNLFTLVDPLPIFGEERRCIHDQLADTKVVQVLEPTD